MITMKHINFGYKPGEQIFKDFSLELTGGETVLISGSNGTGKTTLLRLMSGVLFPQSGSIQYDPAMGDTPKDHIGFISDQIHLYENMTVREAIGFHSDVYRVQDRDLTLLDKTKISMGNNISQLSRGQRAVLHLAMMLAPRPKLILIDEIIHTLDAFLRELFLKHLLETMMDHPATLVLVNLNFHDIEKIPQRVIFLKGGKIICDEPMDRLKKRVKKITGPKTENDSRIIHREKFGDRDEIFVYPFDDNAAETFGGTPEDLNLNDIMKAFTGGDYA